MAGFGNLFDCLGIEFFELCEERGLPHEAIQRKKMGGKAWLQNVPSLMFVLAFE